MFQDWGVSWAPSGQKSQCTPKASGKALTAEFIIARRKSVFHLCRGQQWKLIEKSGCC